MFNLLLTINILLLTSIIISIYYEIKNKLNFLLNEKNDVFLYDYFFIKSVILLCIIIVILLILAINYNIIKKNFLILTISSIMFILLYKYIFAVNAIIFTILEYLLYTSIITTLIIFDINKNKIKKIAILVSWLFVTLPIAMILCYFQYKYTNQFNTNDFFNLISYKENIILKILIYVDIILKIGIHPNFKSIQFSKQSNNESISIFINTILDSVIISRVLFFYNFFINNNNIILIIILLIVKFKFFLEIKKTNLKFKKKIIIFLNQKTLEILILILLINFNYLNLIVILIVLKTLYSTLLLILLWLNNYRFFIFKSLNKVNSILLNTKFIKTPIKIRVYIYIMLFLINIFGWFINTTIILYLIWIKLSIFNFIILFIIIIFNIINTNNIINDIKLTLNVDNKLTSSDLSNYEILIIFLILLVFIEILL